VTITVLTYGKEGLTEKKQQQQTLTIVLILHQPRLSVTKLNEKIMHLITGTNISSVTVPLINLLYLNHCNDE